MTVSHFIADLPFVYPFTISKGTKTHQPTFVVALEFNGRTGYGEAPAISYYNIPVEQMAADLAAKRVFVEKFAFTTPDRYWHYLHHLFPTNGFLVAALDIACWDMYGKLRRKPLYQLFNAEPANQANQTNPSSQAGLTFTSVASSSAAATATPLDTTRMPLTDYTIGIDSIETMVAKMNAQPWPIYKIKLGTDRDIEIMKALREHTDKPFRIDANAAWTKEEALTKIEAFAGMGVEFIEQPLAKDDWEGMEWLYARSPLPLIADESCVFEKDVQRCAGKFHGINIKLTKCTGITPALRMITEARRLGLSVMLGCMNESTIGSAALAHLAPLADYLDADGPLLLKDDLATGLVYDYGRIALPEGPGLGIELTTPKPGIVRE
ncbi:dipeptide epimerase [Flavihumibacter petaseus]|uniref:Dipeptide epimerase n=1 Tax=Flavihumibacter petaseus NBRC 106054 TaxID=1220578 RepID=A0A0E9N7Q5_9BACT|nr:dipeptide epimerase [Flavihumibacter petaseus]GAO45375.1 putative isomerase [Flavihumibacter petaseus NBRC 106054]